MFDVFSVFIECSSGCVPKISFLKDYITKLSKMGYNAVYLGISDIFHIASEPYLGYLRGGYTKQEINELDAFCKGIGVELRPAIQTLAKFNHIGKYQDYSSIIDIGDILLVGKEKTYEFLDKIFCTMSEYFTARTINIGMDEAFLLGLGAYKTINGEKSRIDILLSHLQRVSAIAKKYGFCCEMWSDMFIRIANGDLFDYNLKSFDFNELNVAKLIPDNIILDYWDYVTSDEKKLNENLAKHFGITDRVSFTGTVWKFMGFVPDNKFSISIADPAINACKKNNIKHFQIALWADTGGECSLNSVLPSLFYYSEKAKGISEIRKDKFKEITGIDFDVLMLVDLGNNPLQKDYKTLNNKSFYYLYQDVFLGEFNSLLNDGISEGYANVAKILKSKIKGEYGYIFKTLYYLCSCLTIKAELGKNIFTYYKSKQKDKLKKETKKIALLIKYIDKLIASFTKQWDKENKMFAFEIHLIRLGGLKQRLIFVKSRLEMYLNGKIEFIDELEENHLPFGYVKNAKEDDYMYNSWRNLVSVN